jgi:hypothetical protein
MNVRSALAFQSESFPMKFPKNVGMLLLGVWLILYGLTTIAPSLSFPEMPKVLAVVAIVAGVFVLLGK